MLIVGIDVGGTHVKIGLVEDAKLIRTMELSTNTFDIIRQMCNGAKEIVQLGEREWYEVDGVAVGFPGMVIDSVVLDSPNISLQNCNLKEILEKELDKKVIVRNDAEMATLAEHKLGAGADCNNMILLTLGTGIGGGIIANGKLYEGAGGAGEFGHIVIEKNGKQCLCGRVGCAEQYLSMIAFDKLAKDIMLYYPNTCIGLSGEGLVYASEVVRAYKKDDACAIKIVDEYVDRLTSYILDICNLFRPNRIVIGGGISYASEIIDMVARNARRLDYGYRNSPVVDILPAELGNFAGVLGGYVCFNEEFIQESQEQQLDDYYEDDLDNPNISLLDKISNNIGSINSDKEFNLDDIDEDLENAPKGLYMNKFLDEISTEINNIKNEHLIDDETEEIDENNESEEEIEDSIEYPVEEVEDTNDEIEGTDDITDIDLEDEDFLDEISVDTTTENVEDDIENTSLNEKINDTKMYGNNLLSRVNALLNKKNKE